MAGGSSALPGSRTCSAASSMAVVVDPKAARLRAYTNADSSTGLFASRRVLHGSTWHDLKRLIYRCKEDFTARHQYIFIRFWREEVLSACIMLQLVSSGVVSGTDSPSEDSLRLTKPMFCFMH
jgi:hypothetical protein